MWGSARTQLLTRHFLRRFLDNDFISPHVDLHENVATILAAIVSTSVFVAFFMATKYLAAVPLPGVTAVYALGDKTYFIAVSMIVMGLVAAMQWDALALDARDSGNLGVLPIDRRTLMTAKSAAVVIFAATFALALNLVPGLIYSPLMMSGLPASFLGLVRLIATHLAVTLGACAFGFMAVLSIRELLRAAMGEVWFRRVSALVQALVVLFLLSLLLLLPPLSETVAESWVRRGFPMWHLVPPLWFAGLWETLAGDVVASLELQLHPRLEERNARAMALYHAQAGLFPQMARVAVTALTAVSVAAIAAYGWNARHLPQSPASSQRHRHAIAVLTTVFAGRSPARRAGFAFALQTIARSASHRLAIAAASALAVAVSVVLLRSPTVDKLLVHQTIVLTALTVGFRHAVRLPADLRSNWVFQLAWTGDDRYSAGVKRAAIVALAAPAICVLLPFSASLLGYRPASAHAAVGMFYAIALVEIVFARYSRVPFVSHYVPGGHFKTLGPIAVIGFLVFAVTFARIERRALTSAVGVAALLASLAAVFVVSRIVARWTRSETPERTFDERPEPSTQSLGLAN